MLHSNKDNMCGRIRRWLSEAVGSPPSLLARWLEKHLAECPKCRRRAIGYGRLSVAMSLIKAHAHRADLLMRANRRAVAMLRRPLRETTKAQALRHVLTKPSLRERLGKYTQSAVSAAACLLVLLLMRTGIFSSMTSLHDEGEQAVRQYYAKHLDQDMLDQIL